MTIKTCLTYARQRVGASPTHFKTSWVYAALPGFLILYRYAYTQEEKNDARVA